MGKKKTKKETTFIYCDYNNCMPNETSNSIGIVDNSYSLFRQQIETFNLFFFSVQQ